jgi:hypothetical protein
MSVLPRTKQQQLGLVLFPFKAYTVIGIIFFVVWFALVSEQTRAAYYPGTAFIFLGHCLSGVVLILGGLIERFVLKISTTSLSFVFGIINILIVVFVMPNMR